MMKIDKKNRCSSKSGIPVPQLSQFRYTFLSSFLRFCSPLYFYRRLKKRCDKAVMKAFYDICCQSLAPIEFLCFLEVFREIKSTRNICLPNTDEPDVVFPKIKKVLYRELPYFDPSYYAIGDSSHIKCKFVCDCGFVINDIANVDFVCPSCLGRIVAFINDLRDQSLNEKAHSSFHNKGIAIPCSRFARKTLCQSKYRYIRVKQKYQTLYFGKTSNQRGQ
jgi:hypothetical protein